MANKLLHLIIAIVTSNMCHADHYIKNNNGWKHNNNVNFYLGTGNTLRTPNYFYLHSGVRIALEDRNILYFNADYYFNTSSRSFTLFNANDYNYIHTKQSGLLGLDAAILRDSNFRIFTGLNITHSVLKGKLNTDDSFVRQSVKGAFERSNTSVSIHLLGEYNFNPFWAIYGKLNTNLTSETILSQFVLTIGLNYKIYRGGY